jgi:nicotinamidase-related amidase
MPGYAENMNRAPALIAKARECGVPVVFFQEAHRRDLIDFGRELDGAEDIHLLEGDRGTEVAGALGMRPDDYFIRKRRYSCFFGTEFEILLKGLAADTLILIGGHTDVCVHYTFVDGHQHDYFCRVVEDCVAGSSLDAHGAALRAMEYLQTGARRSSAEVTAAFEEFARRSDLRPEGKPHR